MGRMSLLTGKQEPIDLMSAHKSDVRTQFATLCFRMVRDKPEILLVTSRGTKRWIVPKGWPMDGKTPSECAEIEAWEEAGVRGKVYERCLGLFSYHKLLEPKKELPCVAMLYAMKVKTVSANYPEMDQRRRKWLSPKKAAARIAEPELAEIIRNFHPRFVTG